MENKEAGWSGTIPSAAPELSFNPPSLHPARAVAVVETLLPVFLIIALGAVLTKTRWLDPAFLQGLNRFAYWIALPCLLFESVGRAREITDRPLRLFLVLLAATLTAGLVAWIAARALRLPRAAIGTFVQGAFRGNLALMALPVTIIACGEDVVPVVALAIAPLMILYNVFAAAVLLASQDGADRTSKRAFVRQLLLHPLVLAILAGLITAETGLPVPAFLHAAIGTVGNMAVPVALLGIGGTLVLSPVHSHAVPATTAALIKVGVTPLAGLALARSLHFSAEDVRLIGIALASPTAAASFVMAAQMKGDAGLASSTVVVSTLLSVVSFGVVLAVL